MGFRARLGHRRPTVLVASLTLQPDGAMGISWPAVACKWYRVTTSPDLQAWTTVYDALAIADGKASCTIDPGHLNHLFVRVGILP